MKLKHAIATIALMLSLAAAAVAGPREDAWDAWSRKDYTTAARLFRPLAEQGDPGVQFALGFMYRTGWGVPQDFAEALKWFRMAADQGVSTAQSNLAFMYREGLGVPKDYVQAYVWFNLAAAAAGGPLSDYAEFRDDLAKKMTPEQIAEAQKRAREWKPTK